MTTDAPSTLDLTQWRAWLHAALGSRGKKPHAARGGRP